jgi:hypothetical protein
VRKLARLGQQRAVGIMNSVQVKPRFPIIASVFGINCEVNVS